jgi:hypothetical protein
LPNSGSGTIRRSSIVRRQSNFGRPPSQVISSQAPAPPSLVAKAKFNVPKSTSVDAGIASSTGTLAPPPPPPPPPSVGGPVVRPASLISPSKSELAEIVTPSLTAEKPTKSAGM